MRYQYDHAMKIANEFIKLFVKGEVIIAGSLRRKEQTIGDVDIIVNEPLYRISERCQILRIKKLNGKEKKMDIMFQKIRFNIYRSNLKSWGAMLFFLTGPAQYSIAYRRRAKEMGMKLDQYGLYKNGEVIAAKTEREIYEALGKQYKEPELRGK